MKRVNYLAWLPLLIISIAFYGINIFRSVFIDAGVTDEGFLLNQVNGRSIEGIQKWYLPFTDFLAPVWNLSGGNLSVYRILGLVIFCAFLLPSMFLISGMKHRNTQIVVLVTFAFSGLALSRYLLVTPGYQNLILIASVASVIPIICIIMNERDNEIKSKRITISILLFLGINLLLISSGRITGGASYLGVIGVVLGLNLKLKRAIGYVVLIGFPTFAVFALDVNSWKQRIIFLYRVAQIVDPNGYSVVSEVFDIILPAFPLVIAFVIGILFSKSSNKFKWLFQTVLFITILALIAVQINRIALLLLCIITVSLYSQLGKQHSIKLNFSFFLISLVPYWTVFGSNTPAAGNLHFMLIGIVLLFLSLNKSLFNLNAPITSETSQAFLPKFLVITLITLLYFGIVTENSGYGKSLSDWNLSKHNVYSISNTTIIKNIDGTTGHKLKSPNARILDLSFFHPGIILKLGGLPYPVSLSDSKYKPNLRPQLLEIQKYANGMNSYSAEYVLVKLKANPLESCQNLSDLINDQELQREFTTKIWTSKYSLKKTIKVRGIDGTFGLVRSCP